MYLLSLFVVLSGSYAGLLTSLFVASLCTSVFTVNNPNIVWGIESTHKRLWCACMYVSMYICMYIYVCMYMYVGMYMCVYVDALISLSYMDPDVV